MVFLLPGRGPAPPFQKDNTSPETKSKPDAERQTVLFQIRVTMDLA